MIPAILGGVLPVRHTSRPPPHLPVDAAFHPPLSYIAYFYLGIEANISSVSSDLVWFPFILHPCSCLPTKTIGGKQGRGGSDIGAEPASKEMLLAPAALPLVSPPLLQSSTLGVSLILRSSTLGVSSILQSSTLGVSSILFNSSNS